MQGVSDHLKYTPTSQYPQSDLTIIIVTDHAIQLTKLNKTLPSEI